MAHASASCLRILPSQTVFVISLYKRLARVGMQRPQNLTVLTPSQLGSFNLLTRHRTPEHFDIVALWLDYAGRRMKAEAKEATAPEHEGIA